MDTLKGYDLWRTREPDLPEEPEDTEVSVTYELVVSCLLPAYKDGEVDEDAVRRLTDKLKQALWYNSKLGTEAVDLELKGAELA